MFARQSNLVETNRAFLFSIGGQKQNPMLSCVLQRCYMFLSALVLVLMLGKQPFRTIRRSLPELPRGPHGLELGPQVARTHAEIPKTAQRRQLPVTRGAQGKGEKLRGPPGGRAAPGLVKTQLLQ